MAQTAKILWEIQDDEVEMYCTVGDSPPTTRDIKMEFNTAVSSFVTPVRQTHFTILGSCCPGCKSYPDEWIDWTDYVTMEIQSEKACTATLHITLYHENQVTGGNYLPSSGVCRISWAQIWGICVEKGYTKTISVSNQTSIDAYGLRTLDLRTKLPLSEEVAIDMLNETLYQLKDPAPNISMLISGDTDGKLVEILERQISERITVINDKLGINADFFIEKETHEIHQGGLHFVTWELSKPKTEIAVLGLSKLGACRLGY